MIQNVALIVLAYLIGSFPSAYLVTKLVSKKDIRRIGSGSVGGMNTLRNVGFMPGAVAGLLDLGKGFLVVKLAFYFSDSLTTVLLAALFVVIGHNWMVFVRFSGGKGLGVTAGALLGLYPLALLLLIAAIVIVVLIVRDSYVGTAAGFVCLPAIFWTLGGNYQWILFGAALALVVAAKYINDFKDFLHGRRELF